MTYALWNLVATDDADELTDALVTAGFALRELDTAGVESADDFRRRCADAFGFPAGGGWQSLADDLGDALFPDDDEGSRVAVTWRHADALIPGELATFVQALDILRDIGRMAYADEIEIITFVFGEGPGFPSVDVADLLASR